MEHIYRADYDRVARLLTMSYNR